MPQCYFDLRTQAARGTDSVIADMMRHFHTRQHLGTALVIVAEPSVILSTARKQWLRIARSIQTQRASTLNADKILKYTHTITRMHNMAFTLKSPAKHPNGDVYFVDANEFSGVPVQCFSVYLNATLPIETAKQLAAELPNGALIVDYTHTTPWATFGLKPKSALEDDVADTWSVVLNFLGKHHIDVGVLTASPLQDIEAIDNALDTLLAVAHTFLDIAGKFQRSLELARPLRLSKATREQYDAVALLAHRVQALSPMPFRQQFLEVYNEDDSFFLLDNLFGIRAENVGRHIAGHRQAGRERLATALAQLQRQQRLATSL